MISKSDVKKNSNKLLSTKFIVIFVVLVIATSYVIFKQNKLLIYINDDKDISPASEKYLINLLNKDLDAHNLFVLAEKQYSLGKPRDSIANLKQILELKNISKHNKNIIQFKIFKNYAQLLFANKISKDDIPKLYMFLHKLDFTKFNTSQLREIIAVLDFLRDYKFSYKIYDLTWKQKNISIDFLNEGAKNALFLKKYEQSSTLYQHIVYKSDNISEKIIYMKSAIDALIQGNFLSQALELAKKYDNQFNLDKYSLQYFSELALSNNNIPLANKFISHAIDNHLKENTNIHADTHIEELLNAGYKISIYNRNYKYAQKIAELELKNNNFSIDWHRKAAYIYLWQGNSEQSLKHYMFLIENNFKLNELNLAIEIAKYLNKNTKLLYLLNIKIRKNLANNQEIKEAIYLEENMGLPERAISLIKNKKNNLNTYFYHSELVRIYKNIGQDNIALKHLYKLKENNQLKIRDSLIAAEILYQHNKIPESINLLKHMLKNHTQYKDHLYWRTLGQLSHIVDDKNLTALSYYSLYEKNKITLQEQLLLTELFYDLHKIEKANIIAEQGWKHYHDFRFFDQIIFSNLKSNNINYLNNFIHKAELDKKYRKDIIKNNNFWQAKIAISKKYFDKNNLENTYKQYIYHMSNNFDALSAYMWLLIYDNNKIELFKVLRDNLNKIKDSSSMWQVMSSAYNKLGFYKESIYFYLKNSSQKDLNNILWINNYAYLLGNNNDLSQMINNTIYFAILNSFQNNPYINSSVFNDNMHSQKEINELVINILLKRNQFLLAQKFIHSNKIKINDLPMHIQYLLARKANNAYEMKKVRHSDKQLDYLILTNDNLAISQQLTKELLNKHVDTDDFANLHNKYLYLFQRDKPYISIENKYKKFGSVYSNNTSISTKWKIDEKYQILSNFKYKNIYKSDPTQIINLPTNNIQSSLTVKKQRHHDYEWSLKLGLRNYLLFNLFSQYKATFFNVLNNINIATKLDYQMPSSITTFMHIAGMHTGIEGSIDYKILKDTNLNGIINYYYLYGQNDQHLGSENDYKFYLLFNLHRLIPGIKIALFSESSLFTDRNKILKTPLNNIVPATLLPLSRTYLTRSFSQYGLNIEYDIDKLNTINKDISPLGRITVFNNTVSGLGYGLLTGITTPIIGKDNLLLMMEYSKNQQSLQQDNLSVSVNYKVYF